jgi:hypothetical protein
MLDKEPAQGREFQKKVVYKIRQLLRSSILYKIKKEKERFPQRSLLIGFFG